MREYDIRAIDDFANVPDDRLDDCLKEFAVAIRLGKAMGSLVNEVAAEMYGPNTGIRIIGKSFRWIDDGLRTADITITSLPPDGAPGRMK